MSSEYRLVDFSSIETESEVQRGEESKINIPAHHLAGAQAEDPEVLDEISKAYQSKEPYGVAQETLGWLYYQRFMATSDVSALEKALGHYQAAIDDANEKHPDLPRRQQSLAIIYNFLYNVTGASAYLDSSIHLLHLALDGCRSNGPDLPFWSQSLATAYSKRYEHYKNLNDLELAIKYDQTALETISSDHPGFLKFSQGLAQSCNSRFDRLGGLEDLSKGIDVLLVAVKASPQSHSDLPEAWKTLSVLYVNRFRIQGDKEDLEAAISLRKLAVQRAPLGSEVHIICTQILAAAYGERYKAYSSFEDLELSIKYVQQAIQEAPPEDPIYAALLEDLGIALMYRHKAIGGAENIKLALQYMEFSVDSLPAGNGKIPYSQKNLAMTYLERYRSAGDVEDLKKGQELLELAVEAIHPTDPQLYEFHDCLAAAYLEYFDRLGDLQHLSMALDQYKLAVGSMSTNNIDLSRCEHNISNCYEMRYGRLQDHDDLDLAMQYSIQSLQHMSANHQDIPVAKRTLARLHYHKFKLHNNIADFDSAMKLQRDALDAAAEINPMRPILLHDLAFFHLAYFESTNDITHLNATIPLMEVCIKLANEKPLDSPRYHHTFAIMLGKLWMVERNIDWVSASINVCGAAINSTREDDPTLAMLYHMIGKSYSTLYFYSQDANNFSASKDFSMVEDAYCALYYYRASVSSSFATPATCLDAALDWAKFAESLNLNDTLTAYSTALATLPSLLWIGNSLGDRHNSLVKLNIPGLVSSAVAAALKFNNVPSAVEFLEQGLAVTYRQMLELRDEPTQLVEKYPEASWELQQISLKLQEISDPAREVKQDYHSLVIRQKDLIKEIRTLPGFEDFLMPKTFENLSEAANYGPVVLLNASPKGSDAIILLPSTSKSFSDALSVPLPDATIENMEDWRENLQKALSFQNLFTREMERYGRPNHSRSPELSQMLFKKLLRWLWTAIVKPIYNALEVNGICSGRMWWCPSGLFIHLPIHAAAEKSLFVQSYTTTLDALIKARILKTVVTELKLTAIGITDIPGKQGLKISSVTRELKSIQKVITSVNIISDSEATVSNVLDAIGNYEWLHIACHGYQDVSNPLNSHLKLYDGDLSLSQILAKELPKAQFVFLSACQTAMGSSKLPNESLHLSGGFIVAGCQAAIGTLWNMADSDGPKVAELVYQWILENRNTLDVHATAEALHFAVQSLRDAGAPYERWMPFIHMGS